MEYRNPVLPGFYPDPSVCKYEDTYYMVNSTFQYFPGVTLFMSKDLINWKQIGHVLTRKSQLNLAHAGNSGGIFAPTIRCHNGRFYMVTTNVSDIGNFYVWTDDIYGEWSDPIKIEQDGIDPSFYFEGNTCYFMSNGTDETGNSGVVQCEIDIKTGKVLTAKRLIWKGTGGRYLEGPHLYKIENTYYLLAAEGGTEYGHMVVCAKGPTPYGPFEGMTSNPVLTNRNLGGYEIQGCGHGDLVQDCEGNWWMLHLAFRQIDRWMMYHVTGRETYLMPVTIEEDGTLKVGEDGTTPCFVRTDRFPENFQKEKRMCYTFDNMSKDREWSFLRNPQMNKYSFLKKRMELLGTTDKLIQEDGSPTFVGIRQCEMYGKISVKVLVQEEEAGVCLYMDHMHHYDFAVKKKRDRLQIIKRICIGDVQWEQEHISIKDNGDGVRLCIKINPLSYSFEAVYQGQTCAFGANQSRYLSTEVAGGFTGVMIALYAQSDYADCQKPAVFEDFCYQCDIE